MSLIRVVLVVGVLSRIMLLRWCVDLLLNVMVVCCCALFIIPWVEVVIFFWGQVSLVAHSIGHCSSESVLERALSSDDGSHHGRHHGPSSSSFS